jgi:hypothetical protein
MATAQSAQRDTNSGGTQIGRFKLLIDIGAWDVLLAIIHH